MKFIFVIALALGFSSSQMWGAMPAKNGKARAVIVVDANASPAENLAAHELATCLREITGATFKIATNATAPTRAIFVGKGQAAEKAFRDVPFDKLEDEEWVIRARGERILLAGGRPRGTLYAVSRFLQDQCQVRWWTPWADRIPKQATLRVPDLNLRAKPAFEYRAPFWSDAVDPNWSWRNLCNSEYSNLTPAQGGSVKYNGFVHTFYILVPPGKYYPTHPEWFSLIKGQRTATNAQLCTTNPQLRDFLVEQVRERLRQTPDAEIVSVSQNDCQGACECPNCRALDDAEGSHSGSMIALVNYIAGKIAPEFPHVAVDTLAYQFTRRPPATLRPATNVIVRLCSIEGNFREPLDHPSNSSFADDLHGWARQAGRLYIWDYVTDFGHYIQPHPNWFSLGPNLRFFQSNHVRGVFEEGAYGSGGRGAEMGEMRAWVLAQLLYNPQQNDRALIREFLDGYYGPASPAIARYMDVIYNASQGYYLSCYSPSNAPFLRFKTLAEAEKLWQEAESDVAGNDELLERVRLGHLAVRCVFLSQWDALRRECLAEGGKWPLNESRKEVAVEWRNVAAGVPGKPWTTVAAINEVGESPAHFLLPFLAEAK